MNNIVKFETFDKFGFNKHILQGIKEAGFKEPSPIQNMAIPHINDGKDIIGQAQTGTGKTAAFGLPAMNKLKYNSGVEILVITPTRELASQVSDELFKLGRFANVRTTAVYGGQSISRQVNMVSRGAQVVVATPGRLLDHLKSKRFPRFKPQMVILDEADEMLDMGFIDDIKEIFNYLPKERQTLLFSATMPREIKNLAEKTLKDPVTIKIKNDTSTPIDIEQRYYVINEHERENAIIRLIDSEEPKKSIIFCRTKRETDALNTTLAARGISSNALHGDMKQDQRTETINKFKNNKIENLVATDVAARGIDISGVTHVFNFHIPLHPEIYVHRIGRTGRAGDKGVAITLATPLEFRELKRIMAATKASIVHGRIPTLNDIKKKSYKKLVDDIASVSSNEENIELLRLMEEEFSLSEIANKLINFIVNKQKFAGPNRIGLSANELKQRLNRNRKTYNQNSYNQRNRYIKSRNKTGNKIGSYRRRER